ncbi:MAG: carboxypeptidase regulatory-like domain-containing protein [Bacteroidia bacterium]|nr:carboxypeptidase regulatory-like domain-containing protein [Bacteroidia bacterium]
MRNILFVFGAFIISQAALAQTSYTISGIVADDQGNRVPFANTALYQATDSTLVGGAVSDGDGQFKFSATPGHYYLKVTFLRTKKRSYQKYSSQTILTWGRLY